MPRRLNNSLPSCSSFGVEMNRCLPSLEDGRWEEAADNHSIPAGPAGSVAARRETLSSSTKFQLTGRMGDALIGFSSLQPATVSLHLSLVVQVWVAPVCVGGHCWWVAVLGHIPLCCPLSAHHQLHPAWLSVQEGADASRSSSSLLHHRRSNESHGTPGQTKNTSCCPIYIAFSEQHDPAHKHSDEA